MGRLREAFAAIAGKVPQESVIARIVQTWMAARPLLQTQNVRTLTDEGYRRMSLVYACINELATSAAEPMLKAARMLPDGTYEDLPPTHPASLLLANPNPEQSPFELIEQMVIHLQSAGNSYLHKVRSSKGNPVQLWTLRPDRTRVKVDTFGMVESYEFSIDGMFKRTPPAADVIHFKLPDPLDDFYGLSPIYVLERFGALDQDAADYMRAYFANAGAPSGILKFKTKVFKEERERIKELWKLQHGGAEGFHGVSVLDADADYQSLGGAPERLRLNFIFDATETRICMVFGVPPILVGAAIGLNRATFANYREARRSLWDETLSPLYKRIADTLTRGLRPDFGPDVCAYFDMATVQALQEDREVAARRGLDGWNAGVVRLNEARESMGLEPLDPEVGDVLKAPAALPSPDPAAALFGGDPALFARQIGHGYTQPVMTKAEIVKALKAAEPLRGQVHAVRVIPVNGNGHHLTELVGHTHAADAEETFALGEPAFKALHRIADAGRPEMRAAFTSAITKLREAMDQTAVQEAVAANDVDGVLDAIPFDDIADPELRQGLRDALHKVARRAQVASARLMPAAVESNLQLEDRRAADWAREHAAQLVVQVGDETKKAVRGIVGRVFEGDPETRLTPGQAARQIRSVVGLHDRQAQSVATFAQGLLADGRSLPYVEAKADAYARRLLRQRAELIARTETIRAAHQGLTQTWDEAVESGLIDKDKATQQWLTTDDDRLCPVCAPMEGQERPLGAPFGRGPEGQP